MSRSERIEHIIQQRKPLVEKITNVTNNLYTLTSRIKTLETFKEKLAKEIEDSSIRQNLSYIDFTDTKERINVILPNLSKLKTRFDRVTLNIGVVGMARQGKSTFLQSLTGLTTEEIPDSNMGFCTGVQSAICHKENITTSGLVWFYSPQDLFNEVILPYYDTLNLAPKPDNIYEFVHSKLPSLSEDSVVNQATYKHLQDYYEHYQDYKKWFQINSNPYSIKKEEIREFVSQISSDGKTEYYNYLPVKKVEIICSFPQSDLGKIVLIDTPGIGDTKLNDQDIMVKTLGEDVYEKMASSLFDELVKKYNLSPNPLNPSLLNFNKGIKLSLLMNDIYDKDKIENYNLFFLTLFLWKNNHNDKTIKEKCPLDKNIEKNEKLTINNRYFLSQILDIDKFKNNISSHLYMINIFTQLNQEQQTEIVLIGEFILNHKENDQLWRKYKELMEEIKSFLNKMFQ
jgi:hypothetical protein